MEAVIQMTEVMRVVVMMERWTCAVRSIPATSMSSMTKRASLRFGTGLGGCFFVLESYYIYIFFISIKYYFITFL